ncbi:MAG TPA: zinc ribbon domain-containing protein [Burkholderiaceae bacterium]|nr:zinc ribbon domain-containing protein [Burkholderiaceae bacterium]
MPIYAYRCERCGHSKDVIQKFSDAPLTTCPECGADAFRKQLTAPAFQLKGSGWYVTDFRDGGKKAAKPEEGKSDGARSDDAKPDGAKPSSEPASAKSAEPAASPAAAPAPAPAAPKSQPDT